MTDHILAGAQAGRPIIRDFCPLADSLEWQLGQEYWRERGSQAFIGDATPVPFVINNDGNLSRNAAELLFTALETAQAQGSIEDDLFVLELGIGVGLFARYFLDAFRDLCARHGKDYYGRLTYIAGDRSEQMLLDLCRHGVLANHPGRYRLRLVDALRPAEYLARDPDLATPGGTPLRAVFLNYVLDCLPAAVLEVQGSEVRQLHVRTCLARGVPLQQYTELTPQDLALRALSNDPAARRDLMQVYGLFASEYDYRPVDVQELPHGAFAAEFARTRGRYLLHNYGAIESLLGLLDLVHERGFLLINDYGNTRVGVGDEFEHQRFSQATSIGLNFPLLKEFFGGAGRCAWVEPLEDNVHIYSRLLGRCPYTDLVLRFHQLFSKAAYDWAQEPVLRARHCLQTGRLELALAAFRQALERQPNNWVLLNETARFLIGNMRNPLAGVDLARLAVALNPSSSSALWNTLGDGLLDCGQTEDARQAYRRALQVNPNDVGARCNLAYTYVRQGVIPQALSLIAEALALDGPGHHRERLLRMQSDVLEQLAQKERRQDLLMRNLVSPPRHQHQDGDGRARQDSGPP